MTNPPPTRKRLRLWPGVVAAVLLVLVRYGAPIVDPDSILTAMLGAFVGAALILIWWLFFSRALWADRLGAIVVMAAALFATSRIIHVSIATGAMGMLFPIMAIPLTCVALVVAAAAGRDLSDGRRRATMVAIILLGSGAWALVRTGGFTADFKHDFAWRWSQTPEERLLAKAVVPPVDQPAAPPASVPTPTVAPPAAVPAPAVAPEWPGFRGAARDGVVHDTRIATDWTKSPPVELWRHPIGPGWSSFAVQGNRIYTQEQRGEDEVVACYDAATGKPVWLHRDPARFWESNAGAGPRGTPTLSNGRVYALGATGVLNALDAATGAAIWSRNAAGDTGAILPGWGFSSSPVVLDDMVVVATAGQLAAYALADGKPRWKGPAGGDGYSSPQLFTIDGVAQIVLQSESGVVSVAPADGAVLWEHPWKGNPIVQPSQTANGDVLVSIHESAGVRRLAIARKAAASGGGAPAGWSVEERWTSKGLKPYFNDYVVHNGHAFGFDGNILACIDLTDGQRKWKGGRYGNGQLVLLADQDLLLVLSEEGELALVGATTDQFREFARLPAINGKTWNHPVLVGDLLLVRNGEEMAAFRLARRAP